MRDTAAPHISPPHPGRAATRLVRPRWVEWTVLGGPGSGKLGALEIPGHVFGLGANRPGLKFRAASSQLCDLGQLV